MSIEKNIQTVKDFFAAIVRGDREALLALVAEDIEWIIPERTGRWLVSCTGNFSAIPSYQRTDCARLRGNAL